MFVRDGLTRTADIVPTPGAGYAEAMLGVSRVAGPFARAEVGVRPRPDMEVFAGGQWTREDAFAGLGWRWHFDL